MCAYPKRILPKEGWRKGITGGEIVSSCADAVIARRIDGCHADCIDMSLGEENMSLKIDALPRNRIPNLSTSLLGARFELEDFAFIQKEAGQNTWDGSAIAPETMIVDGNYEKQSGDMFVVGWLLREVDGRTVPYKKTFPKRSDYDSFRNKLEADSIYIEEYEKHVSGESKQCVIDAQGTARTNHDPVNLNYWHFTIDIYPMEDKDNPVMCAKTAWQKMMADNMGDFLRKTFMNVPEQISPPNIENWEEMVKNVPA